MNSKSLTFLFGIAVGATVGSATTLLLAPQSGRRTRRRLRHWGEDVGDRVSERLGDLSTDARRAAERSTDRVGDLVSRGRKAVVD
jgi:gas vesicle protein